MSLAMTGSTVQESWAGSTFSYLLVSIAFIATVDLSICLFVVIKCFLLLLLITSVKRGGSKGPGLCHFSPLSLFCCHCVAAFYKLF